MNIKTLVRETIMGGFALIASVLLVYFFYTSQQNEKARIELQEYLNRNPFKSLLYIDAEVLTEDKTHDYIVKINRMDLRKIETCNIDKRVSPYMKFHKYGKEFDEPLRRIDTGEEIVPKSYNDILKPFTVGPFSFRIPTELQDYNTLVFDLHVVCSKIDDNYKDYEITPEIIVDLRNNVVVLANQDYDASTQKYSDDDDDDE